jgi:hypothetical protein
MVRTIAVCALAAALAASASACNSSSPSSPTVPLVTVSAITVSGTAPTVGTSSQFKAMATMSDGSSQDVTTTATWQSSDNTEATVSSTGVVNALAPGNVTVAATFVSVTGTDQITIGS